MVSQGRGGDRQRALDRRFPGEWLWCAQSPERAGTGTEDRQQAKGPEVATKANERVEREAGGPVRSGAGTLEGV